MPWMSVQEICEQNRAYLIDNVDVTRQNEKGESLLDSLKNLRVIPHERHQEWKMKQPKETMSALLQYLENRGYQNWLTFEDCLADHGYEEEARNIKAKRRTNEGETRQAPRNPYGKPSVQICCESSFLKKGDDVLEFPHYVNGIADMLEDPGTEAPMCIGLFGEWGSGKSGLLKLLEEKFSEGTRTIIGNKEDIGSIITSVSLICTCIMWMVITVACRCNRYDDISCTNISSGACNNVTNRYGDFNSTNITSGACNNVTNRYGNTSSTSITSGAYNNVTNGSETLQNRDIFCHIFFYAAIIFSAVTVVSFIRVLYQLWQIYPGGLLKMCCFRPSKNQFTDLDTNSDRQRCLVPVFFNSWEYEGCSKLWAGVAEKLCNASEKQFGKLLVLYYRTIDQIIEQICQGDSEAEPKACRLLYIGVMFMVLIVLPFGIIVLMLYCIYFCDYQLVWTPLCLALPWILTVFRNIHSIYQLRIPYSRYIQDLVQKMVKPQFDEELGFMNTVKKEVLLINRLFMYMSVIHNKNYYLTLLIDDLDRCAKEKARSMLRAIHVMFNDPDLRLFSIVAVDQRALYAALKDETLIESLPGTSGHRYLKKIIHLPICLPVGNSSAVKKLLGKLGKKQVLGGQEPGTETDCQSTSAPGGETDTIIGSIQDYITSDGYRIAISQLESKADLIIPNPRHVKRLFNICNMAYRLAFRKTQEELAEIYPSLVLFLVMAEQWPFRTSALVHCVYSKDADDISELQSFETDVSGLITRPEFKEFIQNDEDAGTFNKFLKNSSLKTIELRRCKDYIINLPYYMQTAIRETGAVIRDRNEAGTI